MKKKSPIILVVDDDRTILMMLEAYLVKEEYEVLTASNGKEAKEIILAKHKNLDAILLDRIMPDMDGIEVVKWMNVNKISKIPIIMQTSASKTEQVKEGIDIGVFYYLTKPIIEEVLKSIVSSAVKESKQQKLLNQEIARHLASFKFMQTAVFKIQSLEEAEFLACFLANCFPNPYATLAPLAELLINAVEHGNLGVSYEEKSKLIADASWRQEIERRTILEENKNKFAEVIFSKDKDKYTVKITDDGAGFSWQKFLRVEQSRALDNHGRGIARANMFFHHLEYNEAGNQVIAIVEGSHKKIFKW